MDYEKKLSTAAQTIKPSGIRKFFDLANQMEGVISLGVGEPDFATPWKIREAAIYSIEKGRTFYTANRGLLELRQEISNYYYRRFGVHYDPEKEIIVTVGGSEGIDIAVRSLMNPGDEMIILDPGYVAYEPSVILSGGVPVRIHLEEKDEFKLTPEKLKAAITPKTKVMLINFPSNPTGGAMTREDYEKLVPIIKESGIIVISDEIYAELSYEEPFCTLASFPEIRDQVIVINGFSKAYAMTGWRLGYACGPRNIIEQMTKLHQYAIMCAPTTSQYAALEALTSPVRDEEIAVMREEYDARRTLMVEGFRKMGLSVAEPEGAFYVFPDIRKTGLTSEEFCNRLLQEQKVAVIPGNAFGTCGEGFVRCSYAYSQDVIRACLEKIAKFVAQF